MSAQVRIAILGLGEAGSEIARDLVAAGADVRGYDPNVTLELTRSGGHPDLGRVAPEEGVLMGRRSEYPVEFREQAVELVKA